MVSHPGRQYSLRIIQYYMKIVFRVLYVQTLFTFIMLLGILKFKVCYMYLLTYCYQEWIKYLCSNMYQVLDSVNVFGQLSSECA
jgi:hypothetical protein